MHDFHSQFAESRIATLRDIAAVLDTARDALNTAITAAEKARTAAIALDAAYAELRGDNGDAEAWAAVDRARLAHGDAEERAHNTARAAVQTFNRLPR
jgi:hypothetical protein